ncbi:hypothetical protein ABIB56_002635 [Glaciihabitans sp. UYNi722]
MVCYPRGGYNLRADNETARGCDGGPAEMAATFTVAAIRCSTSARSWAGALLGEDEVERSSGFVELLGGSFALLVGGCVTELGDDAHQLARAFEEGAGLL